MTQYEVQVVCLSVAQLRRHVANICGGTSLERSRLDPQRVENLVLIWHRKEVKPKHN